MHHPAGSAPEALLAADAVAAAASSAAGEHLSQLLEHALQQEKEQ
jgi:hypothetical protein